jgi:hypothetical protein
VEPKPQFNPTTCDSVWFRVAGELPDPCYEIVSVELRLLPLDCIACPTTYVVAITARAPAPDAGIACPLVITPYERNVPVGFLTEGRHHDRGGADHSQLARFLRRDPRLEPGRSLVPGLSPGALPAGPASSRL